MKIDILSDPLTSEDISDIANKTKLAIKLLNQKKIKYGAAYTCVSLLIFFWLFLNNERLLITGLDSYIVMSVGLIPLVSALSIAITAALGLMPRQSVFLIAVSVATALTTVATIIVYGAFFGPSGCFVGAIITIAFHFIWDRYDKIIGSMEIILGKLSDADNDTCTQIQHWLSYRDISAYRDKVVLQKRKFIIAEVDAMKAYYDAEARREEESAARLAIDEACKTVYSSQLDPIR